MTPVNQSITPPSRDSRGFTLIELLIVIVILGVLAGIVVFAVGSFSSNGAQSACKADFKTVEVAVESFKAQEGTYPSTTESFVTGSNAVPALMNGDTAATPPLGPWLRDKPTNGTHYSVQVSTDGKGVVQVYNAAGTATLPASSPTHTAADCSSVS